MSDEERELSERLEAVQLGIDAFEQLPEETRARLPFSTWWLYAAKAALEHNMPRKTAA